MPVYQLCEAVNEKYDIIDQLAMTAHSQIYLVRHKLLGELRAAKIVRKSSAHSERILNEAMIIKKFKHSGIPIIYDIEEDSNIICIIEEYIAGKSLTDYISEHRKLSEREIIDLGIQICSILEYLHGFNKSGVMHLDLKPDNILIDGDNTIKIIDFDSSVESGQEVLEKFGSAGYAAPEQYYSARVARTADIYGIGMLLMYMAQGGCIQSITGRKKGLSRYLYRNELYPIINKCIRHNSFQRFNSVEKVKKELMRLGMHHEQLEQQKNSVSKKSYCIYVYGAKAGIGTTHIALCITAYITRSKHKAVCIEKNGDDIISEAMTGELQADGTYAVRGIHVLPDYGDCIAYNLDDYEFKVYDCGTYDNLETIISDRPEGERNLDKSNEMTDSRIKVMVTDIGYRRKQEQRIIESQDKSTVIVINHADGKSFYRYVRNNDKKYHFVRMPCVYDWNDKCNSLNEAMWEILSEHCSGMFGTHYSGMFGIHCRKGGMSVIHNEKT